MTPKHLVRSQCYEMTLKIIAQQQIGDNLKIKVSTTDWSKDFVRKPKLLGD